MRARPSLCQYSTPSSPALLDIMRRRMTFIGNGRNLPLRNLKLLIITIILISLSNTTMVIMRMRTPSQKFPTRLCSIRLQLQLLLCQHQVTIRMATYMPTITVNLSVQSLTRASMVSI